MEIPYTPIVQAVKIQISKTDLQQIIQRLEKDTALHAALRDVFERVFKK